MSKMTKWVIGIIVILVIAGVAWNMGYFGGSMTPATTTTQPAAAATAAGTNSAMNKTDGVLTAGVASIDAQMNLNATSLAALTGAGLTQDKILALAADMKKVSVMMTKLSPALSAKISNAVSAGKSTTDLKAALTDLNGQLSNATSQIGAATANAAANAKVATLQQSQIQLMSAMKLFVSARADIAKIMK